MTTFMFRRLTAAHWLAFAILLAACDGSDPFAGCGNQCTHDWDGTPGSCAKTEDYGSTGGPCDWKPFGGGEVCNDAQAVCVDHVCVPCGSTNEACCLDGIGNGSPTSCQGGESCVAGTDFSICEPCGSPGEKCCGGGGPQCQSGAMCDLDSNECEAGTSSGSGSGGGSGSGSNNPCAGNIGYSVYGIDAAGCVIGSIQYFFSSNAMQAQACATLLQQQNGWPKVSAVNAAAIDEHICVTSFSMSGWDGSYQVVDPSAATSCATELCAPDPMDPQYGCHYTTGTCPTTP